MTEIERKALALVNEVQREFGGHPLPDNWILRDDVNDEALCRAVQRIEELEAENAKLREEIRQIYVDATEQYSDWCNMGPIENEARDWAFDLSQCALEALKG